MQYEPGNLGSKVGFVYGAFSLLSILFVWFCLPECGGRSLEELDELFQAGVQAWNFKGHQTTGIGARIAQAHDGNADLGKLKTTSDSSR